MDEQRVVSRRGMVAGLGVAGAAGAAALLAPTAVAAAAEPLPGHGPSPAVGPRSSPDGAHPLASAPKAGHCYAFVAMWDFSPENYASGRRWSSAGGVFTPSAADTLWASVDLPTGAVLADIEWYVSATEATALLGRLWVSGTATLFLVAADGSIPAGPAGVRAVRTVAPGNSNGPYPHGSKLTLGAFTPASGNVCINGARVGYTLAPAGDVLLPKPVRIYDSRQHSKIAAGATRIHSLAAHLPVGATGAIVNLTATQADRGGYLVAYSADATKPATSSLNYSPRVAVGNSAQTGVSAGRAFKLTSSSRTHYIVDLIGYLA